MGKALLVIIVFALVVYGVLRLLELRKARRTGGRTQIGPTSPPPRRPLAPDDDPNFLRDLEQRQRREQHERDQRSTPPPPKNPGSPAPKRDAPKHDGPKREGPKHDGPEHDDESEAS